MKNLFLTAIIAVSFVNCSGNDDDSTPQQNNPIATQYFHVPSWIRGNYRISGTSTSYFIFKENDFILVTPYTSYKTVLEQTATTGQQAKVNEQISDLYYEFTIIAGGSSAQYKFKKISDTRIQWVGNTIPPVYLDKE